MHIARLRLFAFRSHRDVRLELGPGLTVIHGLNGQGKTNLLEGIAVLALTRSPLADSLSECVAWGAPAMRLTSEVQRRDRQVAVDIRCDREGEGQGRLRRQYRLDGQARAARALLGALRVVCFWPDDLGLIKGAASGRRRLLDVALSQGAPAYAEAAVRYRRALEQRNAALRAAGPGGLRSAVQAWDTALITHGSVLIADRAAFVAALAPLAALALAEVGEPAPLALAYRPRLSAGLDPGPPAPAGPAEAAEWLAEAIRLAWPVERARGQTLVGPHRDEVEVTLGGRSARAFASQGQQRSIVLALKIAEVRLHRLALGEDPVLLLDDVLSELDPGRQAALLGVLAAEGPRLQTLLTAAGDGPPGAADAAHLHLTEGRVEPERPAPAAGAPPP